MKRSSNPSAVGVAMSGGVDSTAAAALLLEQGFSVHGFFMVLPLPGVEEQIRRVQHIADRLHIPLHLVELEKEFRQRVIAYFIAAYQQGLTPNPCVVCNRQIKFGLLLKNMTAAGMDRISTGHYAAVCREQGQPVLRRGADPTKDQSYFLCRLSGEQLERIFFPLGDRHKQDVFAQMQSMGFTHFQGGESQDVCFLAESDLASFLAEQGLENSMGEIAAEEGRVLGRHQGIWKYTVGQRRGLGIPDATPWYVLRLDAAKNRVIVGKNEELFRQEVVLTDVQWQIAPFSLPWQGRVQLRSRHKAAEAEVSSAENNQWKVRFSEPQRAVTPGQFAVFYLDDLVVGSGVIQA
ncbi:MAG: tRNA 2-thiouridine(34) synthase MnmA [Candidatus Electrothrix sp. YB6]